MTKPDLTDTTELKRWLIENSSGAYRPSAEAAGVIDQLEQQVQTLTAKNDKLSADLDRFKAATKKAEENGYGQDSEHNDDSWIDDLGQALDAANVPAPG